MGINSANPSIIAARTRFVIVQTIGCNRKLLYYLRGRSAPSRGPFRCSAPGGRYERLAVCLSFVQHAPTLNEKRVLRSPCRHHGSDRISRFRRCACGGSVPLL